MPKTSRFERCENCWWRSGPHETNGGGEFHKCRFNPPVVMIGPSTPSFDAVFPRVQNDDFCGKFEYRLPGDIR